MDVLDHHQDRLAAREAEDLIEQVGVRAIAKLLCRERGRQVRSKPKQCRNERQGQVRLCRSASKHLLQLGQPDRFRVGRLESGREVQLLHHRPERGAGILRRALAAEHDVMVRVDRVHKACTRRDFPMPASPTSSTA